MTTRKGLGWCLAVVWMGCADAPPAGGPTEVIPTTLPASVPLAQYVALMARVECARLFRCAASGQQTQLRVVFGTYERCVAHDDELPNASYYARQQRVVAMGTRRYDGAAARRCLDALRAGVCASPAPSACDEVLVGTVAEGGECRHPEQCAGDAYCAQRSPEGRYMCPGRCTPRVAAGASCPNGDTGACSQRGAATAIVCNYDQALRGTPNPYRCMPAMPGVPVEPGEICYDPSVPGNGRPSPCLGDNECRRMTTPDGGVERVLRCLQPPALGELCTGRCQGDAVCEFDQSVFQQRCVAVGVRSREGDTCVQGNRGSESCNVLLGLDCVAGRCRRVGTGAVDSPCFGSRYGVDNCARGLYCSAATQTCQRRKADGVACRSGEECESRECVVAPGAMATTCGVTLGCQ
jgi:hypothetical protein